MSKTIIFHCDEEYHIESSLDSKYINALKQDHNNKQAYIVCDENGLILEEFGYDWCVLYCKQMVDVLKQKYGSCTVYKTDTAYYNSSGDKIRRGFKL